MNMQRVAKHFPMWMRTGTQHVVVALWKWYLRVVTRTSKITFRGLENIEGNRMLGFWHEDCYCMQLLLRELKQKNKFVHVIVTAERRGDYIAEMVSSFGHTPVRLPDGMKMRSFLKDLKEQSKTESLTLAAAMDGPRGPYRKPKRLLFLLANESEKDIVYVRFRKKGMICLPWRWDKYRIPLPFSRLQCDIDYMGPVEKAHLRNFEAYATEKFADAVIWDTEEPKEE